MTTPYYLLWTQKKVKKFSCLRKTYLNAIHKYFVFTKGETLLSPLVMCGPHGTKFLKAVELRLPHSAAMTSEGWSFALNSNNDEQGGNVYDEILPSLTAIV